MQISVILDAIVAVVLLVGVLLGIKRGLFLSLAWLAVLIFALVGANLAAKTLAPPISRSLSPMVEKYIEQRVDGMIQSPERIPATMPGGELDEGLPKEVEAVLEALGLGERFRAELGETVMEKVRDTSTSVIGAVAESLLENVVWTVIFVLSFAGLTLVLHLVVKALDLVLRLPGLHFLNAAGGAVAGGAQAVVLLFLLVWLMGRFGWLPSRAAIGDTVLLQFFVTNGNMLTIASF